MILEIFSCLKCCDSKKAEQDGIDQSVIGRDKDHDVINLPLAVDQTAHDGMNKNDADKSNENEKRAKNHSKLGGGKAVKPRVETFDHPLIFEIAAKRSHSYAGKLYREDDTCDECYSVRESWVKRATGSPSFRRVREAGHHSDLRRFAYPQTVATGSLGGSSANV